MFNVKAFSPLIKTLLIGVFTMSGLAIGQEKSVGGNKGIIYVSWDGSGDYNCDGSSDQVEINKALQYVASHPKYTTVYLKGPHTYWIDQPIAMPSNMKLTGDETATVQLIHVTADIWPGNKPMIYPAGQKYWESHDDYKFDIGTALYGKDDDSISNVEICGFKLDGGDNNLKTGKWNIILIQFFTAHNIKIHDMKLYRARGDLIRIMGGPTRSTKVRIYNNILYDSGHDGTYLVRINDLKIYNNEVYEIGSNAGFRVHDCSKIYVYKNIIGMDWNKSACGYAGIYICVNGFEPELAEIYDNYIYGRTVGILVYVEYQGMKGTGVHIHHNRIFKSLNYEDDPDIHGGIRIVAARDVLIEYNTLEGGVLDGIIFEFGNLEESQFTGKFKTIVRNNIISNYGGYGIKSRVSSGKHHYELSHNNIYNCSAGFYDKNIFTTPTTDVHYNPLYANTKGDEPKKIDLHLKSQYGRWNGSKGVKDKETSPLLLNTPADIAFGAYGNTRYASRREKK